MHATGVSFCTRRHFGRPQGNESRQYIRFAFSGINKDEIAEGLELFGNWVAKA
jgi:DNA-binding transcriptional MocR family regulator